MSTVSIRLSDDLLKEADNRARKMNIPRAEYVRRVIEEMNRKALFSERRNSLFAASRRIGQNNMAVHAEFDAIERDVED